MVLFSIIIKTDIESGEKRRKEETTKICCIICSFQCKGEKGRNNSWQPKGLKRLEFYKYFGEKGAQDVRKEH